ncbi:MAG: hypothetical protein JXR58_08710 [Bacteroidales bacterium]|nr:hypothetical protein [Bacteroidales bacterium]
MQKNIFLISLLLLTQLLFSQETDSLKKDALKVFIDCDYCDESFIKKEITWVNYVRDYKEADVHVLVSQQNTGSGGTEFTFYFIGRQKFALHKDTLVLSTDPDMTSDEVRSKQTEYLKLGLFQYALKTPLGKYFSINFTESTESEDVKDPWNAWVIRLSNSMNFNGEELYKSYGIYNSLSVNQIKEKRKIQMSGSYNTSSSKYIFEDTTYKSVSKSNYTNFFWGEGFTEHWSAGITFSTSSSIYSNYKFSYSIRPTLEYNIFKYSESTRKQLRIQYKIGHSSNWYNDTTIYDKIEEKLYLQSLSAAIGFVQPWGSINASVYGSHYLHDLDLNEFGIWGSLSFRVFKGLSVYLSGNLSFIHNQLSLPKMGATEEEVLLRQKQLATQYSYYIYGGISYTFGSIYNNVVNPRFGD